MGTLMAPRLRIAKSEIDHSGRFSERSAMRSPGRMPSAAKHNATSLTRSTNSAAEMFTHCPPVRWLNASALPCLSEALKHKPGTDETSGSELALTLSLVDAAEDT